jgi:hypothetical protein
MATENPDADVKVGHGASPQLGTWSRTARARNVAVIAAILTEG